MKGQRRPIARENPEPEYTSGYWMVELEKKRAYNQLKMNIMARICKENRKKLQKALNKKMKEKARVYTIT